MDPRCRPGDESDLPGIWEVFRTGFGARDAERERWMRDLDPARTVVVDGPHGEIAAAAHLRPFEQIFGGRPVRLAGYSPVAVLPEHRGRGLARAVTVAALVDARDRGEVIAGLFPSSVSLYRAVGFEVAGSWVQRRLPAAHLAAIDPGPNPTAPPRRGTSDDIGAVRDCYRAVALGTDGALLRSDAWWERRLPSDLAETYLHVIDGEDGAVRGYAIHRHARARFPYDFEVSVSEVLGADEAATRALWRLVGSSGTTAPDVSIVGPAEDPLFLLLGATEPTAVRTETRWMVRLVDAAGAVEARGWNPLVSGRVHLQVCDDHAPWNDGPCILEVDGGRGRLLPGGDGAVEVSINALSSWWSGYSTAGRLRAMGLLRSTDDGAVALLDHLGPRAAPSITDFY